MPYTAKTILKLARRDLSLLQRGLAGLTVYPGEDGPLIALNVKFRRQKAFYPREGDFTVLVGDLIRNEADARLLRNALLGDDGQEWMNWIDSLRLQTRSFLSGRDVAPLAAEYGLILPALTEKQRAIIEQASDAVNRTAARFYPEPPFHHARFEGWLGLSHAGDLLQRIDDLAGLIEACHRYPREQDQLSRSWDRISPQQALFAQLKAIGILSKQLQKAQRTANFRVYLYHRATTIQAYADRLNVSQTNNR